MMLYRKNYPSFLQEQANALYEYNERLSKYITADKISIKIDGSKITFLPPDNKQTIEYIPEPTPALFHVDNSLVRLIMGPYGSGKSSACIAELILRAARMPICGDGVRHYAAAIIRNTYAELETTTLVSWDNWTANCFETVSRNQKPPMQLKQRFRDEKGIVEMNLLFLSLDDPRDIKKIKSLEVTDVFINEACEVPFSVVSHLLSRTGRYPTEQMRPSAAYERKIIMDTNPPDVDHAIYQIFEVEKPADYKIFKQPPAVLKIDGKYVINPNAENLKHQPLGAAYYLDMIKGATEEYIKVFAMGEYGLVMTGKPVYAQYNDDLHSVDEIKSVENIPLVIGWDFGLTPACLISQQVNGQVRVLKEFCTDRMGLRELAERIVLPYLRTIYKDYMIISKCDPTGISGNDTDGKSCLQVLNELGLPTSGAYTNAIVPRIEAVNFFLNYMSGQPAYIISRKGCPNLRKGFLGKYGYKRIRVLNSEEYRNLPDKSHPFSDIHDCNQYICLEYQGLKTKTAKPINLSDWINPLYRGM